MRSLLTLSNGDSACHGDWQYTVCELVSAGHLHALVSTLAAFVSGISRKPLQAFGHQLKVAAAERAAISPPAPATNKPATNKPT